MLNFKKRVNELSSKTSSVEAKEICKKIVESYAAIKEDQLHTVLVEKLKNVTDADKHVANFLKVSAKLENVNNLGIAKEIGNIKESSTFQYPALKYAVGKIENAIIGNGLPEYVIIDEVLESLKPFLWDATIEASYKTLSEKRNSISEDILVAKSIFNLARTRGSFMYDGIVEKLESHFVNPTQASRSALSESLSKFAFQPEVRSLVESLRKLQQAEGKLQLVSEAKNVDIKPIYSPVHVSEGKEYFFAKGKFFKKANGIISKVEEAEVKTLPANFINLCRIISSPDVFVKEGKVSFYMKRNKVEVFEKDNNVEVQFNGAKVSAKELGQRMVSAGMFRMDESKVAMDIQNVAESFNSIFDLDFAKIVESNIFKGSYAIIMTPGNNKIFVNKVNESMKTDEFFPEVTAIQARNTVMEFLGYDIKESFSEFLNKEEAEIREMQSKQTEILKNLAVVEGELHKVKHALQDNFLSKEPKLLQLESLLTNEINALKNQSRELSFKIKSFEGKASDVGFGTGDEVKTSTGETGTVQSVNSSTRKAIIVTEAGKTQEVSIDQLSSIEDDMDAAGAKNASNAEKAVTETENLPAADTKVTAGVKGKVSDDQGGKFAGMEVEISAEDFASKGDDELIEIKVGDETAYIEKKFLKVSDEPVKEDESEELQDEEGEDIDANLEAGDDEDDDDITEDDDNDEDDEDEEDDDNNGGDEPTPPVSDSPIADVSDAEPAEGDDDDDEKYEEPAAEPEVETSASPAEPEADVEVENPEGGEEPAAEPVVDVAVEEPAAEVEVEEPATEEPAAEPAADVTIDTPELPAEPATEVPITEPVVEVPEPAAPGVTAEEPVAATPESPEVLHAKLMKTLGELEEIKANMGSTFTSNDTITNAINSLRGMIDALKKDQEEATAATSAGTDINASNESKKVFLDLLERVYMLNASVDDMIKDEAEKAPIKESLEKILTALVESDETAVAHITEGLAANREKVSTYVSLIMEFMNFSTDIKAYSTTNKKPELMKCSTIANEVAKSVESNLRKLVTNEELTAKQKKLPAGLQAAILKKQGEKPEAATEEEEEADDKKKRKSLI